MQPFSRLNSLSRNTSSGNSVSDRSASQWIMLSLGGKTQQKPMPKQSIVGPSPTFLGGLMVHGYGTLSLAPSVMPLPMTTHLPMLSSPVSVQLLQRGCCLHRNTEVSNNLYFFPSPPHLPDRPPQYPLPSAAIEMIIHHRICSFHNTNFLPAASAIMSPLESF